MVAEIANAEIVFARADTGATPSRLLAARTGTMLILDLQLRIGTGLGVLKAMQRPTRRGVLSPSSANYAFRQYRERATTLGADHFFDKARDFDALTRDAARERRNRPPRTKTASPPRRRAQTTPGTWDWRRRMRAASVCLDAELARYPRTSSASLRASGPMARAAAERRNAPAPVAREPRGSAGAGGLVARARHLGLAALDARLRGNGARQDDHGGRRGVGARGHRLAALRRQRDRLGHRQRHQLDRGARDRGGRQRGARGRARALDQSHARTSGSKPRCGSCDGPRKTRGVERRHDVRKAVSSASKRAHRRRDQRPRSASRRAARWTVATTTCAKARRWWPQLPVRPLVAADPARGQPRGGIRDVARPDRAGQTADVAVRSGAGFAAIPGPGDRSRTQCPRSSFALDAQGGVRPGVGRHGGQDRDFGRDAWCALLDAYRTFVRGAAGQVHAFSLRQRAPIAPARALRAREPSAESCPRSPRAPPPDLVGLGLVRGTFDGSRWPSRPSTPFDGVASRQHSHQAGEGALRRSFVPFE